MKKLLSLATLVALGAGTVSVGAMDDVQVRGSDTLNTITKEILTICPAADPGNDQAIPGVIYIGSGSSNGEQGILDTGIPAPFSGGEFSGVSQSGGCADGSDPDTILECQTVAPMSRFLESQRSCQFPERPVAPDPQSVKSAALAEGISFALDGLSVVTSAIHQTTCNDDPGTPNPDPSDCNMATDPSAGMASARVIAISDTANGIAGLQCPGCVGINYTLGTGAADGWKDVLRIVYTGLRMGVNNVFDRDCNGDLRHTLVNDWGNLFQNDCDGSGCTQLRHAFRRDDESGTTDVFLALIGAPGLNIAGNVSTFCNVSQVGDNVADDAQVNCPGGPPCETELTEAVWSGTAGSAAGGQVEATQSNDACVADADCTGGLLCVNGFCTATNEFPGGFGGPRGSFGTHVAGWMNAPYNSDFQDNDPIRRVCAGTYDVNSGGTEPAVAQTEQVCRARRPKIAGTANFEPAGTLGLVLPINPPPITQAEAYPTKPCRFGSFSALGPAPSTAVAINDPEYPAATRTLIRVDRCPNGDIPSFLTITGGRCFVPLANDGDPACINGRNNLPTLTVDSHLAVGGLNPTDTTDRLDPVRTTAVGGAAGLWAGDGRVYNLHLYFLDAGNIRYRTIKRQSVDVPIMQAFYRIHTTRTLTGTGAGTCQGESATQQIGCLVQASPCSIGYAGREAADPQPIGTAISLKVRALEPTNTCVGNLLNPPATFYPIARQLYLNTYAGFENVTGQEQELAKCFSGGVTGGLAALETKITQVGFIPRSAAGAGLAAPACRDFQQQGAVGGSTQGCNQPLVSGIACAADADCPLGYTCNGTVCAAAANDACTNNGTVACAGCPGGVFPANDPLVP